MDNVPRGRLSSRGPSNVAFSPVVSEETRIGAGVCVGMGHCVQQVTKRRLTVISLPTCMVYVRVMDPG